MAKYLNYDGLQKYNEKVKETFVEEADLNINQIKKNGITVQPVNKVVDIQVPVKTSDLTNDSNFVTEEEVNQKIANISNFKEKFVDSLPATGEAKTIYFVPKNGSGDDIKDEYMWVEGKWEFLGSRSAVVEVEAISDSEIDALFN